MKKVLIKLGLSFLIIVNLSLITSVATGNYSLKSIITSAFADCEDDAESGKGSSGTLNCTNSSGEEYSIDCCDFDDGYLTSCNGRPCD